MPNNHPYDKKGDRRQQDLNDLVDGAVNFGLGISYTVLSGIAGALDSVGDSLNRAAQRPEQNSFIAYRRKLDNSLAGHYGGWMTMGVLGWVFGGCFAIAALVMAILAGVAPNDASLWSSMPVFNILAPMFTACTLGFFVMGYAVCHAANYFGRLRRYLRGMHGFTAELPELTRSSVVRADKVRKDLRNALAKGHYPNACMNEAETTLYLDETMYHPAPAAAPVQPKAVFATRSPFRPNPLGLSSVKLEGIEMRPEVGPVLLVRGADLMDGTPIYDIKPYIPYADCHPDAAEGFTGQTRRHLLEVSCPEELWAAVPQADRDALRGVLANDPRPSYQHDPERVYGMEFGGLEVHFTVDDPVLTVRDITRR